MSLVTLRSLEKHARQPFPFGYPADESVVLWGPEDNTYAALVQLVGSAECSLAMRLPALDSGDLRTVLLHQLRQPYVHVSLSLALVPFKDEDLTELATGPSNSVAYGKLDPGTALGMVVIDGLDVATFGAGTLTVHRHPVMAARARVKLDLLHEALLKAAPA